MYLSHHRLSRAGIVNASAGVLLLQLVGLDFDGNKQRCKNNSVFPCVHRMKCRRVFFDAREVELPPQRAYVGCTLLSARQTAGRAAHPVGSRGGNIIRKAENAHGQAAFAGVCIYYDGEIRSAHMDAAPIYRARDLIIIIYLYESQVLTRSWCTAKNIYMYTFHTD